MDKQSKDLTSIKEYKALLRPDTTDSKDFFDVFGMRLPPACRNVKEDSETVSTVTPSPSELARLVEGLETISAPLQPLPESETSLPVKKQTSAPFFFQSLKEKILPPFQKPPPEPQARIVLGDIMNRHEATMMIAASEKDPEDGMRKYLRNFLLEKKIVNENLRERDMLLDLIVEVVDYGARRNFNAFKLACHVTIYLRTHLYFKWYYWSPPAKIWAHFQELMMRHTVEDAPNSQEVFEPEESFDIMTHFHALYMRNLPLIHILSFGVPHIKLEWPQGPVNTKRVNK